MEKSFLKMRKIPSLSHPHVTAKKHDFSLTQEIIYGAFTLGRFGSIKTKPFDIIRIAIYVFFFTH